jgi:hypothetical protein
MNRPGTTCSQDDRHRQVLVFERVEKEQRASLLSLAGGSFHGKQIVSIPSRPQVNAPDKHFTADLTPKLLLLPTSAITRVSILRLKLILSRN